MADDVLINKAAAIERCVARAREEYQADPNRFAANSSRQDAAILNIQRACEAALDMGQHLIRRDRLGKSDNDRRSPVGWARFLCPRGFKAVAFEWWAEKHCPPYNLIEIRTKAVIRIYKPMTATGRIPSFNIRFYRN